MFITNENPIFCLNKKPEIHEMGIGGSPKCNEIEKKESISFINKQSTVKKMPKNEIIKQDKISIIYNKPLTKEEGIEGGSININEISYIILVINYIITIAKINSFKEAGSLNS